MKDQVASCRVRVEVTPDGARGVFRFAPDLPVFAGHFPWHPLVPSVMLIESVRQTVEAVDGRPLHVAEVVQAKFIAQVGPGDEAVVSLALDNDPSGARRAIAEIRRDGVVAAKLTLLLTPTLRDG